MNLIANVRTRIWANRVSHVKRYMAGKVQLNVKIGEEVQPQDVLGTALISAGFSSVNIAKMLGVPPSEGGKYLQRALGKIIYKGELLAFKKGMFGEKAIKAPTDGLVEFYDDKTGELRLQLMPKTVSLIAGVFGIIDDVNYDKNEVTIKTMVTEVFGILGSGKERGGILDIIGNQGGLVNQSQIKVTMHQHVLVAGSLVDGSVLKSAAGFGLSGIICGGLNVNDYKAITGGVDPGTRFGTDIGISVMATEGFGLLPMGDDIFSLIEPFNNKFVFIHGNARKLLLPTATSDSILTMRKIDLALNKSPDITPEVEMGEISIGNKVRIVWPPFMGLQGQVLAIDQTPTVLDSGISTILLTIETLKQKLRVPFVNIEIIK
ncbi:hypothetical protein HYW46_00175 [Candidatus Daviesbacteria bacterium]|nr:hypothetical protein [Candidatus Daviesbacteria bacterium]